MWQMSMWILCLFLSFQVSWFFGVKAEDKNENTNDLCKPERVHLSYGNTTTDMVVMWESKKLCSSEVQYAAHPWNLDLVAKGDTEDMTSCGGRNCSLMFIHRVVLKNLSPSSTVYYRLISGEIIGRPFYFHVPSSNDETGDLQFFILSQMSGAGHGLMMKSLVKTMYSQPHSAIFLMNKPQELVCSKEENAPIDMGDPATNFPLMIGADAETDDEMCTRNAFSMPGPSWPRKMDRKGWYSLDIGLVHIVVYSSKVFLEKNIDQGKAMQSWMVKDLTAANKRRTQTPWIIAIGSDSMYCQDEGVQHSEMADCARNDSRVRHGLEDIFYHFAVDLILEVQPGVYERTWPHYKNVLVSKSYENPGSPVEVILAAEGPAIVESAEDMGNETAKPLIANWTALRVKSDGSNYGHLSVANISHLHFEWRSNDKDKGLIDDFWLVQEEHGNFSLATLPHDVSHRINQSIIAMGGKPGTYDFISTVSHNHNIVGEGWSKYSMLFGLGFVGAAIVIGLGTVTIRSYIQRKRSNAGRRWREKDCQGSGSGHFYSMASDTDSDSENDHDFEIDMFERASKSESKLLTSY